MQLIISIVKKKIITILTLFLVVFVFAGIFHSLDAKEFAGIQVEEIGKIWKEVEATENATTSKTVNDAKLLALLLKESPTCKIGDTVILQTAYAIPDVVLTSKHIVKSGDRYFKSILIEKDDRFFTRFYYTMTVASTVGFGDIYPVSKRARAWTILLKVIVTVGWITSFENLLEQNMKQTKQAKQA